MFLMSHRFYTLFLQAKSTSSSEHLTDLQRIKINDHNVSCDLDNPS